MDTQHKAKNEPAARTCAVAMTQKTFENLSKGFAERNANKERNSPRKPS